MRTNYHSHTTRCRHATGTEEEYVQAAIKNGFSEFGFSDHCPWEFKDGFVSTFRMLPAEFPGYLNTVRALGKKYADKIKIYCGLECEYYPDMLEWMRELVLQNGIDYLLLGNHFDTDERKDIYFGACHTPQELFNYADRTTKGMQTGMFRYLAHPDLCFRAYEKFDANCVSVGRALCRCAREMDMPLEYNLLGRRYTSQGLGYPCKEFWESAAGEGIKCIIGVDAHHLDQIEAVSEYDEAAKFLDGLGIERIIKLPLGK